ncbi:hypothetical protein EXU57_00465 [Segetibacter sp. 3557_3]|uniref:hypothetical protein n=1 Tax=Segetibacter sp. 3557_3 TaxID=2547429 RepID=UPI001058AFCE|nr:hypothetical protein [Segetibacter sp. 3557_3]TDH28585.1 hypothetical protein EXU57_00465 [Segetibacter sp. 3557_3]
MAKSIRKPVRGGTSAKRTTIAPRGDKRYIKRNEKGQIVESDDVGKSLSRDIKQRAKKRVKPGQGDQGDQSRRKPAKASAKKAVPAGAPSKKSGLKKSAPKKYASGKPVAKKAAAKRSGPPNPGATKPSKSKYSAFRKRGNK